MQNRTIRLLALSLLFGSFATATSADQKAKSKKASDTKAAHAAEKALRLKVVGNIESIVAKLNLSSAQKAKVKALTSESQWKQAVMSWTSDFDVHGRTVNSVRNRKFETGRRGIDPNSMPVL